MTDTGRNEPCPCGSGRKFKRCCGVGAAPKLSAPSKPSGATAGAPGMPAGFDPSSVDPQTMMPLLQAMQRLPRGQVQRLQALMQKAMAGKDVSREAAELERTLPLEFQELVRGMNIPGMGQGAGSGEVAPPEAEKMSEEEARKIVANAAAAGKISPDQAEELLQHGGSGGPEVNEEKKGIGKFFRKLGGKT